jgi:XTP/dITP diphosphohydrolase
MRILLASTNAHKLEEIRTIIDGGAMTWELLTDRPGADAIAEPVEDAPTFEGNASIKACHYANATGEYCLADDSGIEVDALNGAPGVFSARYAGDTGPERDLANNRKLLHELGQTPTEQRTARFVCTLVLAAPADHARTTESQAIACVRGTVEGRIIRLDEVADPQHPERGRGDHGFGYDPLFLLPERGVTTAELAPDDKNAISHRGEAARAMREKLHALGWV